MMKNTKENFLFVADVKKNNNNSSPIKEEY